jgi:hypothetical protein
MRYGIANERPIKIVDDVPYVLDPATGNFVHDNDAVVARELTESDFHQVVAASRVETLMAIAKRLCHIRFEHASSGESIVTLENLTAAFGIPQRPFPLEGKAIDLRAHPLGFGIIELSLPVGRLNRAEIERRFGKGHLLPRLHLEVPHDFHYWISDDDPKGRSSLFAGCTDDRDMRASIVRITYRTERPE